MINASIYKNDDNLITGFKIAGHADYAEYGSDVVCAAVSVLVINTINSIKSFTSTEISLRQDEKKGIMEFHVLSPADSNTNLLLSSLALGLDGIAAEYSDKYIKLVQVKPQ